MGGIGSGRSGGRPTVEEGLSLDIDTLRRQGLIRTGDGWGGTVNWSDPYTGSHKASAGYEGSLGAHHGRLRLFYTVTTWDGTEHKSDYSIDLVTTPQPFGGRRWWFVCPKTAKRVSKLYLPPGAVTFASRGAHRLAYKSQRETPFARSISRAWKARRRLGDHQSIGATIEKPPGMRWRTFDRLLEKVEAAEGMATRACW
jgi:hypothetical protein